MYIKFGWKAGYFLFGLIGLAVAIIIPFFIWDPNADKDVSATEECNSVSLLAKPYENGPDSSSSDIQSTFPSMKSALREIYSIANQNPCVYWLSLATGLRLGAGYIWVG
jgi:hypothetical protein